MTGKRVGQAATVLLLASAAFLSCGEDTAMPPPPPPPDPPSPAEVLVGPSGVRLTALGDTARFTAEVRDQNGQVMTNATVTWVSSDTSVLTVDMAGLATALSNGSAELRAQAGSASGSVSVVVEQEPAKVVVLPAEATLAEGDTLRLVAEVADANDNAMTQSVLSWQSSAEDVVIVDETGLVEAVGQGQASIAAVSGGVSGTAAITVTSTYSKEREILVSLYEATGGTGWTRQDNWLSEAPLDSWHGVKTSEDGHVVELSLPDNNLVGTLPPEVGNLSEMEKLSFYGNDLSGPLPSEMGNAIRLRELGLGENNLNGEISPALGKLVHLRFLYLEDNEFEGEIPIELGALTELTALNLYSNALTGPLPSELGDLRNLNDLYVDENQLTGTIPSTFTKLTNIRHFNWADNDGLCAPETESFEAWRTERDTNGPGCSEADRATLELLFEEMNGATWTQSEGWLGDGILEEWHGIGTDSLGRVSVLDLSGNGLTGRLSPLITELYHLVVLRLSENRLEGPIPGRITSLALQEFRYLDTDLCVPGWSRSIMAWLQALPVWEGTASLCPPPSDREILIALYETTRGTDWTRQDNWLTDRPLRDWYGVETAANGDVVRLSLWGNNLRGKLPLQIGQLGSLRDLDLSFNWLNDSIPPQLGDLGRLEKLDLLSNRLVGSIPPDLGSLQSLEVLWLASNLLEGPIPPELGNLQNVISMRLNKNELSGPIPPDLGGLRNVEELWLFDNRLEGSIPPELENLQSVEWLHIGNNKLSGEIPPELGNLQNVTDELNLQSNMLSGPIPPELGNLVNLDKLKLGVNRLTGALPAELGRMKKLSWMDLSENPDLGGPLPASFRSLTNLTVLKTTGTGLCRPDGSGDWAAHFRVPSCDVPTGSQAYLIQTVQSLEYPVPLVASEDALLRVFVVSPQSTSEAIPAVRATFFAGGTEIHSVDVPKQSTPIPTDRYEAEASLEHSSNVWIPANVIQPGLEMVVEIDPDGTLDSSLGVVKRIPESGRMAVAVEAMPTLNLTLVPFLWNTSPDSLAVELAAEMAADPEGHGHLRDTHTLLPVGDLDVVAHDPVLTTNNNSTSLLQEISMIWTLEGSSEEHYYMGIMSGEATGAWGVAWIPGRTSYVRVGAATQPEEALTVAHELGHNMSLYHAPCGTSSATDPVYPFSDGSTGAWGIDSSSGQHVLVPNTHLDMMSYCIPAWVGDYHFSKSLRYRHTTENTAATDRSTSPVPVILLWGGTEADGTPFLHPAFAVDAPPVLPSTSGEYQIVGRTANSNVLFELSFDMTPVADLDGEEAGFVYAIPSMPEWAGVLESIELSGPGGSAILDGAPGPTTMILRDSATGQVRGILRDMPVGQASDIAARLLQPGLEVLTSSGIPPAEAWQR